MNSLPTYATRDLIHERLAIIFPEGTPNRNFLVREVTASIVFTHLYIGAVEGNGIYLRPSYVYKMTYEQATKPDEQNRIKYREEVSKPKYNPDGVRWYSDTSKEQIRDESLQNGLVNIGATLVLPNIPTTSSRPRYYLKRDFAALFDPILIAEKLFAEIKTWQAANLTRAALMRLNLAGQSADHGIENTLVTFPNKETRILTPGPSTPIAKAVIEVFAHSFLEKPALLWLSTSDDKTPSRDDKLATAIGLKIQTAINLPDIILVDLAPKIPLLIFIEVVATDGAMTERRQAAFYELTDAAQLDRSQVLFVTAYSDRGSTGFSKTIKNLAWNTFVWFMSEPENLVYWKKDKILISKLINV